MKSKNWKGDKEEYIKALVETREKEDPSIFRRWMTGLMIRNLRHDIDAYLESVSDEKGGEKTTKSGEKTTKSGEKTTKSREKILELLSGDGSLSAALKAEGRLRRVGPDKGGHWTVNDNR